MIHNHICFQYSYGTRNRHNVPGAANDVYDWGDARSSKGSYGSMQIHSTDLKSTIFAMNHWNDRRSVDIGIGSNPEGHPDWTFAGSKKYKKMKG